MGSGRLLLLDTASLYYRAFFALPTSLQTSDGTSVNAVRGIVDFIATLVTDHRPERIIACWDNDWRPQWRVAALPSYKAHRLADHGGEETPVELVPQVPAIAQALPLLGVPVVGAADFEADDVIAALSQQWAGPVDVVTGDRDLFQLVNDAAQIRVLYTARGVSKLDTYDEAAIIDKYGISAGQYVDFAVLRGDPSDGLPGVSGIGDKTAAKLLNQYGSLSVIEDAVADPASDLTPRIRTNLQQAAQYIAAARKVVQARFDVPVQLPQTKTPKPEAFREFAERWSLGGAANRALAALNQ